MADKIGPSFVAELILARVPIDGLAWDMTNGTITETVDDAQRVAAEAVLARHDPSRPAPEGYLELSRESVVLAMHGLGVLKAFIAAKCKATDLERWQSITFVRRYDPVFGRMCASAVPPIDPDAVFSFPLG